MLAHYYVLGASRRTPEQLVSRIEPGVRWTGIAAFIVGVVVAYFTNRANIGIPALQGLIVAGLVYTALEMGLGRRTSTNVAAASVR